MKGRKDERKKGSRKKGKKRKREQENNEAKREIERERKVSIKKRESMCNHVLT